MNPQGNLFSKSIEICVFADDSVTMPRDILLLNNTQNKYNRQEARNIGLTVSESKTKYMKFFKYLPLK